MGDSAGGHAALNSGLFLAENAKFHENLPKTLFLLFPWVNLTYFNANFQNFNSILPLPGCDFQHHAMQLMAGMVLNSMEGVEYNYENLQLVDSILKQNLEQNADENHQKSLDLYQKVQNHIHNPINSPILHPPEKFQNLFENKINVFIHNAGYDVLSPDVELLHEKLEAEQKNLEKKCENLGGLKFYPVDGVFHGWIPVGISQGRHGVLKKISLTSKQDLAFEKMVSEFGNWL